MRFRRVSKTRRMALPALALIVAGGAGWYWAMPGLPVDIAEAHTTQPVIHKTPVYHGALRHGGIPLETLLNAKTRLDDAAVRNSHGDPVGYVRAVEVGSGGRPKLVEVGFGGFLGIGTKVVPFKADTLGYDPKHNIVLTDMTVKQLAIIVAKRDGTFESEGG